MVRGSIIAIALTVGLTGCSVDDSGLLLAQVIPADGAVVVDIYYLGGAVRTAGLDAGASLGFSRRSYIYPAGLAGLPENGWHWLHVPLPRSRPIALATQTYGLDTRAAEPELSVALGYEAMTVMAYASSDTSIEYGLAYRPDDPAATTLFNCEGLEGC
jgi:hypothetical protein